MFGSSAPQPVPVLVMEAFPGQEPLTASMLAAAPLMDQKQLLGKIPFCFEFFIFC